MKSVTLLCLLGFVAIAVARPDGPFDNVDIDEVFDNRRLFISYIKCILEIGKCTRAGKDLRANLSDILKENSDINNEDQKQSITKVIDYLVKNEPEYWTLLKEKYDPAGIYLIKYETKEEST